MEGAIMKLIQVETVFKTEEVHQREKYSPEYENGIAYVNGEIVSLDKATIPITDCGFIHSDATYDVVTASGGYVFRLPEHLERFRQSCKKFQFNLSLSTQEIQDILISMVSKSGFKDCYIWWCATRGAFPSDNRKINPRAYSPNFYAFVIPYRFIANDEIRNRGFSLTVARDHIRISDKAVDPTAKNFHWMDMKLSMFEAYRKGFDWAVLTDDLGNLTECPGCNIFFIKNKVLHTPKNGCLEGITRKSALDLGKEIGLETTLGIYRVEELIEADEVFLTSSAGGIMPVSEIDIDGKRITYSGNPLTISMHNLYWEKRWSGWHGLKIVYKA